MHTQWIRLQSIPPEGIVMQYDSAKLWSAIFEEFHIPCTVVDELVATIDVFPQPEGVLLKGTLRGTLSMPCDRCTDQSRIILDEQFSGFEVYPDEAMSQSASDDGLFAQEADEAVIRPAQKGNGLEINPLAYAWEELSLALPVKPLCKPDCRGLCPACGCNKNIENCSCEEKQGDSRLAVLRGLKLSR